jgi:hypothetical protein
MVVPQSGGRKPDRVALANLKSSRQACEDLLQDVLDDGASDNVTVIVGRTIRPANL